jgi:RNA-binding protein Musashi
VGGLGGSVTEQDFRHYFEEFGKITDAVVMIDRDTQRSRGFGFITFEEEVRGLQARALSLARL